MPLISSKHPLSAPAALAFVAAALAWPALAFADATDDKVLCVEAYKEAQRLRQAGELIEAREQLAVCSRSSCPKVLQQDCAPWLADVLERLPSVLLQAEGPGGEALVAVRVLVDGELFVDALGGRAVPIDPGKHTFRFELEGAEAVEETLVIREGEKERAVTAKFASISAAPRDEPGGIRPVEGKSRPVPTMTYVLGGVGVVGLGVFTGFGLSGLSSRADLEDCRPRCPQPDVDSVSGRFVVADVALAVSVVSLGLSTYLYLSRPEVDAQSGKSRTPTLAWTRAPGGGTARLGFSF